MCAQHAVQSLAYQVLGKALERQACGKLRRTYTNARKEYGLLQIETGVY